MVDETVAVIHPVDDYSSTAPSAGSSDHQQGRSPAARLPWAFSEVLQAQPRDLGVCARFGGRIAAVHPEATDTWSCVQHEEDGANASTCAHESI